MWAQHADYLSRNLYAQNISQSHEGRAHIRRCALYLDAQACLGGNKSAGRLVGSFLRHNTYEPKFLSSQAEVFASPHSLRACERLAHLTDWFTLKFAQLSRLALQIRTDAERHIDTSPDWKKCIEKFRNNLAASWEVIYPYYYGERFLASAEQPLHVALVLKLVRTILVPKTLRTLSLKRLAMYRASYSTTQYKSTYSLACILVNDRTIDMRRPNSRYTVRASSRSQQPQSPARANINTLSFSLFFLQGSQHLTIERSWQRSPSYAFWKERGSDRMLSHVGNCSSYSTRNKR